MGGWTTRRACGVRGGKWGERVRRGPRRESRPAARPVRTGEGKGNEFGGPPGRRDPSAPWWPRDPPSSKPRIGARAGPYCARRSVPFLSPHSLGEGRPCGRDLSEPPSFGRGRRRTGSAWAGANAAPATPCDTRGRPPGPGSAGRQPPVFRGSLRRGGEVVPCRPVPSWRRRYVS